MWCLPGGFLEIDESIEGRSARAGRETGIWGKAAGWLTSFHSGALHYGAILLFGYTVTMTGERSGRL